MHAHACNPPAFSPCSCFTSLSLSSACLADPCSHVVGSRLALVATLDSGQDPGGSEYLLGALCMRCAFVLRDSSAPWNANAREVLVRVLLVCSSLDDATCVGFWPPGAGMGPVSRCGSSVRIRVGMTHTRVVSVWGACEKAEKVVCKTFHPEKPKPQCVYIHPGRGPALVGCNQSCTLLLLSGRSKIDVSRERPREVSPTITHKRDPNSWHFCVLSPWGRIRVEAHRSPAHRSPAHEYCNYSTEGAELHRR